MIAERYIKDINLLYKSEKLQEQVDTLIELLLKQKKYKDIVQVSNAVDNGQWHALSDIIEAKDSLDNDELEETNILKIQ